VRKGAVSPKIASTVGYLSALLLKAIEGNDTDERLARVERVLHMRGFASDQSLFDPDE
jgi:hypothetical protein